MSTNGASDFAVAHSALAMQNQIQPRHILVVGDLFLDKYTTGHVSRISPEAPIPILSASDMSFKAGGAGNVALNLIAMGNQVSVLGRLGCDEAGKIVRSELAKADTSGILSEPGYFTATKHRILANHQQLLRIDTENCVQVSTALEEKLLHHLERNIAALDAIAVSDYGKGLCSPSFLKALMSLANSAKCPVIVDPKGKDLRRYQGATVLKPNLAELHAAVDCDADASNHQAARRAFALCAELPWLLLTKSNEGMTLYSSNGEASEHPVKSEDVVDVTGAGDTALAALTHSWACNVPPAQCAHWANCAAGIAIKHLGCAQIDLEEILHALTLSFIDRKYLGSFALSSLNNLAKDVQIIVIALEVRQLKLRHLQRIVEKVSSAAAQRDESEKIALYCGAHALDERILHLLASTGEIDLLLQDKSALQALIESKQCAKLYTWQSEGFELKTCSEEMSSSERE